MERTGWRTQARGAAMAAVYMTMTTGGFAQTPPRTAPVTPGAELYRADVAIDETIVDEAGQVIGTHPSTRYRLTRRRVAGHVETEIAYAEARLYPRGPLTDPRGGHRYVFTPGTPTRIYDATGTLVASIDDASTPDQDDSGRVVFADRNRQQREVRLRTSLGRPAGRHGTRLRHVTNDGETVTETLVEPDTMLPVEVNVTRDGALQHREWHTYGRMPGSRWYLATTRSESALADGSGRRLVSTRTYTNVAATEGR